MYATLLGIVAVASLCTARLAQDQEASSDSDAYHPSMEFPSKYPPYTFPLTPSFNNSRNSLTLPIIPNHRRYIVPKVFYDFSDPPAGMELAASMLSNIYKIYIDRYNPTIDHTIVARPAPYPNFVYSIQPSLLPGSKLTPLKMGLVYCTILDEAINLEYWPRHLQAHIMDENEWDFNKQDIGILRIDDSPRAEAVPAATASLAPKPIDGANGGLSITPVEKEKRFLRCITKPLFSFIQYRGSGSVTDDPQFNPHHYPYSFNWECGYGIDQIFLWLFSPAAAGSPHQLTWDKMIKTMVAWVTDVAQNPSIFNLKLPVVNGGVVPGEWEILLRQDSNAPSAIAATA